MLLQASQPVVVNVWATWCKPCVEEFPELLAFAREQQGRVRVVFVSADFGDRRELVERFLRERGVAFTTYLKVGSDEEFIATLSPQWSGSLPATFVFAPQGKLVSFFERKVTKKELEQVIATMARNTRKGGKP